ncbi:MAG: D-Ala-D-Ala carboxypeptidase family metallohydrolase [Prevotella sp.]|nr:D-Ala-D-Ala carboxypeptidase family metallohydrolase [Prevotella sp.]
MRLTRNFTYEELCNSNVAERRGINNRPRTKEEEKRVIENLKALCMEVLQPLRDFLGKPVVISSGYRCAELNKAVGGVRNSQHMKGEAADIHVENTEHLLKIMHFIMDETDFDQVIWERNRAGTQWVHVSYKREGVNRHQVMSSS